MKFLLAASLIGLATAACNPCACDANGVVAGIVTNRKGCAVHIADYPAFCYVLKECKYPLMMLSETFSSAIGYYDCVVGDLSGTSDECDANYQTAPPTPMMCPAEDLGIRGNWLATPPGGTASIGCPAGMTGTRTRLCLSTVKWDTIVDTCLAAATCTDGIRNGAETGIDCGGTCPTTTCPWCTGVNCGLKGTCNEVTDKCDCRDGYTGDRCQEAPVDKCVAMGCKMYTESCTNGVCKCLFGYSGPDCSTPPAPTCFDGIKNGNETGVDCGNKLCPPCEGGVRYEIGEWGACSKPCGGGQVTRVIKCVQDTGSGGTRSTVEVELSKCEAANLHRAVTVQACNENPCGSYVWKLLSDFGPCSRDCGTGTQTRQAVCVSSLGDVQVNSTLCNADSKPFTSQDCNTPTCSASTWATYAWGACTKLCGGGNQTRTVSCDMINSVPCPAATKPATWQACNLQACGSYSWFTCNWDDCTATCNGATGMLGMLHRTSFCKDSVGAVVDSSLCDMARLPITVVEGCNTQSCSGYNWMADGPWSKCEGLVQTRTFHCHAPDGSNALSEECNEVKKPKSSRTCKPNTCQSQSDEADVGAAHSNGPLSAFFLAILGLGASSASSRSQVALLAVLAMATAANASPAMPKQEHLLDVSNVVLEQTGTNTGESTNGHPTPFAHEIRLTFDTPTQKFELELSLMHHLLAADYFHEETMENGEVKKSRVPLTSYHAKGTGSCEGMRGSVTLHSLEKFFGVLRTAEDIFTITPHDQLTDLIGTAISGLSMYRESDLNGKEEHAQVMAKFGAPAVSSDKSRKLLVDPAQFYKPDCHSANASEQLTFFLGLVVDHGYIKKVPMSTINSNLQQIVATSSDIYSQQFRVNLAIKNTNHIKSAPGGPAWNLAPVTGTTKCNVASASADLNLLKSWAAEAAQKSLVGVWHLFTDCFPPPGTVGIAWAGVLCENQQGYNTGLTTYMASRTWLTFAHEIGHNFAADHSFEEGQGTTGGIMDYGDGKLNGVYQFNKKYRETEMCTEIKAAIGSGKPYCIIRGNSASAPTAARAPTPPPTTVARICGKTNAFPQCTMWTKLGACTNPKSITWMEANCGPACCTTNANLIEIQCGVKCEECISTTECHTCKTGFVKRAGKCYTSVTVGSVGATEYLWVEVVASGDLPASGFFFTGTLGTKAVSLGLESGKLILDIETLSRFDFGQVTAGQAVGFDLMGGNLRMHVGSSSSPALAIADEDFVSFAGVSLAGMTVGNIPSAITIFGVAP